MCSHAHTMLNDCSFRISVPFIPVERGRLAFAREVWSALMTMDVTPMTLDSVVRQHVKYSCIHQLSYSYCLYS